KLSSVKSLPSTVSGRLKPGAEVPIGIIRDCIAAMVRSSVERAAAARNQGARSCAPPSTRRLATATHPDRPVLQEQAESDGFHDRPVERRQPPNVAPLAGCVHRLP